MLRWIIQTSLQFRHLLVFLAFVLLIVGAGQVRNMAVDVFPEFAPPLVEIQTEAAGLSTEEVEGLITVPIEDTMAGMQGLTTLRSRSARAFVGCHALQVRDRPSVRPPASRGASQQRQGGPSECCPATRSHSAPVRDQPRHEDRPVIGVQMSYIQLSETYRWKIRPWLMKVPGVARMLPRGANVSASCRSKSTRGAPRRPRPDIE